MHLLLSDQKGIVQFDLQTNRVKVPFANEQAGTSKAFIHLCTDRERQRCNSRNVWCSEVECFYFVPVSVTEQLAVTDFTMNLRQA